MDTTLTTALPQPKEHLSRRQRRRLKLAENQALDQVAQSIERATNKDESKQPRFQRVNSNSFFMSVSRFIREMDLEEPSTADPRKLDEWYRKFAHRESYLSGVLNSVIQIDKNRGWKIIGGRNQVARYTNILHAFNNNSGWRDGISQAASSYYTTRMGFVVETGTEGDADNAPLRALWNVDPCRCKLTGNNDTPLQYYPRSAGVQDWLRRDYIRAASMVSTDETQLGYGFPAIARCVDLARIMVAVYQHDNEQLGARAPRGLLLLNGISQAQWETAMQAREETLDGLERDYFGGVAVLAGSGAEEVSAQLTALSTLPKDWDTKVFTDLLMYCYALAFGYDPREFYPVSSGSLGTATETETQHRKASSKGDLDFSLAFQEQLQLRFPPSLQFEFEQRDVEGEQNDADLGLKKAQVITELTKWVVNNQAVLTSQQIIQLAVDQGVLPDDFTPAEEDVTATDTDAQETERLMQVRQVREAMRRFPQEPIVEYSSKTNRVRVLIDPTRLQRRSFPVTRASVDSITNKFASALKRLVQAGFRTGTISLAETRSLVKNAVIDSYIAGLEQGGISTDEMDSDDAMMMIELSTEQLDYVPDFVKAVRDAAKDKERRSDILDNRINLWAQSIAAAGQAGLASAQGNESVTWKLGATEQHCKTCQSLSGQKHRRKWFAQRNYYPGKPGAAMDCGGYNCDCSLEK